MCKGTLTLTGEKKTLVKFHNVAWGAISINLKFVWRGLFQLAYELYGRGYFNQLLIDGNMIKGVEKKLNCN